MVSALIRSDLLVLKLQGMEHQMESYLFAKSMTQRSSLLIKELLDEELRQSTSILSTMILKSGLRSESLKEMSTDNHLTFISAQLLVISLCESLNMEMQMHDASGANCLESEKQLANRTLCLKEMLINKILKYTDKTV